ARRSSSARPRSPGPAWRGWRAARPDAGRRGAGSAPAGDVWHLAPAGPTPWATRGPDPGAYPVAAWGAAAGREAGPTIASRTPCRAPAPAPRAAAARPAVTPSGPRSAGPP